MTPDLVPCAGKGGGNTGMGVASSRDNPGTEASEISIAAGSRSHINGNKLKQWKKL
jgi:hypothetical protein